MRRSSQLFNVVLVPIPFARALQSAMSLSVDGTVLHGIITWNYFIFHFDYFATNFEVFFDAQVELNIRVYTEDKYMENMEKIKIKLLFWNPMVFHFIPGISTSADIQIRERERECESRESNISSLSFIYILKFPEWNENSWDFEWFRIIESRKRNCHPSENGCSWKKLKGIVIACLGKCSIVSLCTNN